MKKIIILSLIILVTLFVTGCTSEIKDNSDLNTQTDSSFVLVKPQVLPVSDFEEFDRALEDRNSFYCNPIESVILKNKCFFNLAVSMQDINLCKSILIESIRVECESKIVLVDSNK